MAALLLLLFLPAPGSGADLSLASLTSATSWEEEDGTANSAASEYLKFHSRGGLGGFRLDLEGYGRFTAVEEEVEPGDEEANRLYVLAMTLATEDDRHRMTLGRQFVPALVGPEMIDGLTLTSDVGKVNVKARWGYRSDVAGGPEEDTVLGLGFDYLLKPGMYLTLDYGRTYDDRLLSELIATEWSYSWYRFTRAYASFNWDLMSRTLHESLVGTRLFFSDRFTMVLELAHNVQTFESDSIYSVFAVDAAYTRAWSLLFTPSRNTRYAWDYVVESYDGGGSGKRYTISGHWTPGRWILNSSLLQHTGYGGDLLEVTGSVSARLADRVLLGLGGDAATSENPGEGSVGSSRIYLNGSWKPGPDTSLDLRLERCRDELIEPTRTGRLSFKVEF